MKVRRKPIRFERLPKDYVGLCKLIMPRPIHDKVDLENVTDMAEALAGHALTEDQTDYFDLLSGLIETFDREHVPPSKASGLDALRRLVNEHGMSGADLDYWTCIEALIEGRRGGGPYSPGWVGF